MHQFSIEVKAYDNTEDKVVERLNIKATGRADKLMAEALHGPDNPCVLAATGAASSGAAGTEHHKDPPVGTAQAAGASEPHLQPVTHTHTHTQQAGHTCSQ